MAKKQTSGMNVAVITEDFVNPIKGGGGFRAVKCAEEFERRGCNPLLFGPAEKDKHKKIPIVKLNHPVQGSSLFSSILSLIKFEALLGWKLFRNRKKIDAIFLRSSVPAMIARPFALLFRKKLMLDITDIQAEYMRTKKTGMFAKLAVKLMLAMEYSVINRFKKIIVVSEAMKDVLVKRGIKAKKIEVVYDGVDLKEFKPYKKKPKLIIHHGGANAQDGVEMLPRAAKIILLKHPDAKFCITGGGNRIGAVKGLVKKFNLHDSFDFAGWLEFSDLKKRLGSASIGVVMRPNTLANNTVLTLKLLEYWATATAPVMPRLKAMQEVATDKKDVMFFEPENHNDLADKIIELLDDKKLLKKVSDNALKTSKKFEWDALISKIIDITEKEFKKSR